jgi:formate dehydrogenase alpha subunit
MKNRKHITAIIDGEPVQAMPGSTILDAALQAGMYIPTLCYLKDLKPYGGCRLCMVEIKGWKGFPTACTTPLEPGMEILTKTQHLQKLRAEILEFTLSEHPYTCLVCQDRKACTEFMHTTRKSGTVTGCNFCTSNGDCELQELIDYLELADVRFPISYRNLPAERKNPFYDLDYNLCILCGRCVRICNEERNSHVLAFVQRGNSAIVGTAFNESQLDAGCEFCGACVDVCPTGSISEKMGKWAGLPSQSTETSCVLCSVGCTMNVNIRDNRVVNVGPEPGRRTEPRQLCLQGKFLPGDFSHHPSRIHTPLIRRSGKWVEVSWKEALQHTSMKLAKYRDGQFGMICSAQDTLEDNYILQKFTRKVMRSNHVDLFASYPDRDLAAEIHHLNGGRPGTLTRDILKADTCLILGTDASVSHPMLENSIRKAFNEGHNILYANHMSTRTSLFANLEIHYAPGEEYHFLFALLAGLAREKQALLPEGMAGKFSKTDVAAALKHCAVRTSDMEPFIRILAGSRKLCIVASDDYLRNDTGRLVLRALENFRYLMARPSGCHLLIPYHEGNVYAGMLAGVHPDHLPGFDHLSDRRSIRTWNRNWNASLSDTRGLSSQEMINHAGKNGLKALMVAGDIPPVPGLKKISFLVQLNMFSTGLSDYADVFLPVTGFLENQGHFMTLEGKIKNLRRALPIQGRSRTIAAIISSLAQEMDEPGFPGSGPVAIWKEMRLHKVVPAPFSERDSHPFHHLKLLSRSGSASKQPVQPDHFRYRGNKLTELIPDLQTVVERLNTEKTAHGQGT